MVDGERWRRWGRAREEVGEVGMDLARSARGRGRRRGGQEEEKGREG